MPKRVLAIGVGGSGKASITLLKERLVETYGHIPDSVALLSLDTDDLRPIDHFVGIRLSTTDDGTGRPAEFQHIASEPGVTLDTLFGNLNSGALNGHMRWLEKDKLNRTLSPTDRDIRGGAQQRRAVGRVALFQRWHDPVYQAIHNGLDYIYGTRDGALPPDATGIDSSKHIVFVIGSLSGGTGSGFLLDVLNLVRHASKSHALWQSIELSAVIVLPEAFSSYTNVMDDPTNLRPNAFAAMRELDRFTRVHSSDLPYLVRYDSSPESITWSTNQPADHIYLVDTISRGPTGNVNLGGEPEVGIFPLVADFLLAHIDRGMGDAMATARSNAPTIAYNKELGWQYSGFNATSYIFPVSDIIQSFSYRFVREMLARQFLPLLNPETETRVREAAQREAQARFSQAEIGDLAVPAIIRHAITGGNSNNLGRLFGHWQPLIQALAPTDQIARQDQKTIQRRLASLKDELVPSKRGDFRSERFEEGYLRLLSVSEQFLEQSLGPLPDNTQDEQRNGGEWDQLFGRYPQAVRRQFTDVLDRVLRDILNMRDPKSGILLPARLPTAMRMVDTLRTCLIEFKENLQAAYAQLDLDAQLRQTQNELHRILGELSTTRSSLTLNLFSGAETVKAQENYIATFDRYVVLLLQQRLYQTALETLDVMGATSDSGSPSNVLDTAAYELADWQARFVEMDREYLVGPARAHAQNRQEKARVKVRHYLTNPDYEERLYRQPDCSGYVAANLLGQLRGEMPFAWARAHDDTPLRFCVQTTWAGKLNEPAELSEQFLLNTRRLFQPLRKLVTIADRLAEEFSQPERFITALGQLQEPFLRYDSDENGKKMFHERYISFNLRQAGEAGREFLTAIQPMLQENGFVIDNQAESSVAFSVIDIARGARLNAIDQFTHSEADYRTKLYQGRETLHLFPEEQLAAEFEGRIDSLAEPDNHQRLLAPELVVTMGDESKLRAFALACAYQLIRPETHTNPDSGERRTEIYLNLPNRPPLQLSNRAMVRNLDPRFHDVSGEEQIARLYFQALQNFTLKYTEREELDPELIETMGPAWRQQGLQLDPENLHFALPLREVNQAIAETMDQIGPLAIEEQDPQRRSAANAQRCLNQYLLNFCQNQLDTMKRSPAQHIRDLGTVLHLLLEREIAQLSEQVSVV